MPYRILIVDDEKVHRDLLNEILCGPDYEATEAASGKEALALVPETDFDVVLLDIRMPGMDGIETCRAIQRLRPLLPIIMVTGFGGHDDLVRALQAGATDFVRKPYVPQELEARVKTTASHKRLTDQLESAESMLFALARIVETRDEGTGDHCSRVAHAACTIGQALGLDKDSLQTLRYGGVLHDLGKLAIPDRILLKPGPLTPEEWQVMRQHTVVGALLCSEFKSMKRVVPIVRHHHERWDGSGYPDSLGGEDIPLLARVFQFADIYDALSHARPYKAAWSLQRIIAAFEGGVSLGHYDPRLAAEFLTILRRSPESLLPPPPTTPEGELDRGARIYSDIVASFRHSEGEAGSPRETAETASG